VSPTHPVDVSIEVLHVYPAQATPESLARQAAREARWVETVTGALDRLGRSWSICMLIDDTDPRSDPEEVEGRLHAAWADTGFPLDHSVRETECVRSIGRMVERFTGEVEFGLAGALGTAVRLPPIDVVAERRRWLANGEPARPSTTRLGAAELDEEPGEADILPTRLIGWRGSRTHSIHLDIELWSTVGQGVPVWSCPMLAAWWQLLRLGAPHIDEAPLTSRTAGGRPLAFHARSTLTILPPRLLEVEDAVWTILERVVVPTHWLVEDPGGEGPSTAASHLDRVGYVFTSSALDV
jgi:hypothetical protein